jgi:hypothetical protein
LALLLIPLILSSCAGLTPKALPASQSLSPAESQKALVLLQELYQEGNNLSRFALRGRAGAGDSLGFESYDIELVAVKPDSFVLSILDPLGRPAFKAVSQEGSFRALDFLTKTAYEGQTGSSALSSFLPIPIDQGFFLQVFSASLPEEPGEITPPLTLSSDDNASLLINYKPKNPKDPSSGYAVKLSKGPYRFLTPSPNKFVPEEIAFLKGGKEELKVIYEDYSLFPRSDSSEAYPFPRTIVLSWRQFGQRTLKVTVTDVSLGFSVPQGLFDLSVPDGFKLTKV